MKNFILLFALASFAAPLWAQKLAATDVPQAVIAAFKKSNPTVSNPEWDKDKSNFRARYIVDKKPRSITYSSSGTLIVHDSKVAIATLPPGVKVYLDKNFPGHADDVNKVLKMTKKDGTVTYDVEIDGNDLIFDSKGTYIRTMKK
jgi:hypothetical protein